VHEPDGTHVCEYAIQMKKNRAVDELLAAIRERPSVIGAEIR
jgi:hypothetical protein